MAAMAVLAILNLYVAPMTPIKSWLNLTYGLGGDVILKNFKMATVAAILDIGMQQF